MPDKKVQIKVGTDVDSAKVKALEDEINKLKQQRILMNIEANTQRLEEVNSRIETVKSELQQMQGDVDVEDADLKRVETELESLESEKINLEIAIEEGKLDAVKAEIDSLDDESIRPQIDNISAMEGIEQISQGFDRLKQGASEIGDKLGVALEAAGKQETNKAFLSQALNNAELTEQKLQDINGVVQALPGDDTILQGLLSQAVAKEASLTTDELTKMGGAAADYFSAMENFGKSSSEAFQDMNNYLLTGQTAEIERSPILANHIDKLKEGATIQERSKLLQEALNEEHWGGISQQDTYNNKLQTFNGMLERGQYNLGGMFQEGAKGAMDFALNLDEASGGLVGMGLALVGFASPLTDAVMGLGQIGTGLKGLKDAGEILGLSNKLSGLKTAFLDAGGAAKQALIDFGSFAKGILTTVVGAIKDAALALKDLALKVLEAGYNALKSAALWAYEKLALIASTVAEYGLAAAQAILNAVMSMNPIMLVVIALAALAAALVWAYYNVDWFREMVDNAWASLQQFAGQIMSAVAPVIEWLGGLFQNFTSQLGLNTNDWIQAVLGFILFLPTLPAQIGIALTNALARALGFKGNFVQTLWQTASDAVSRFRDAIQGIGAALQQCLDWAYQIVMSNPLVQALQWLGDQAANAFSKLGLGQSSPGKIVKAMTQELDWTEEAIERSTLPRTAAGLGNNLSDGFNPNLETGNFTGDSARTGNITINIEIGSVDNEDRINEIVDAVTRALNWDNKTAGRTV